MQETKKITTGIEVKLNKSDRIYHCIRIFIKFRQGKNELKDTFKLRWDNVYEAMELSRGENILRIDQLVKISRGQASFKKNQVQLDKMKETCFLLISYRKGYSFLLKQLRDRDNVERDEC